MVGVSVLPVCIHNGELLFLFGKEVSVENKIQGYSDFGGGREKDESTFDGAIREGCEELTGFYGNEQQLREKIAKAGGTYDVKYDLSETNKYFVHIFLTEYDKNLPTYFENNHKYLYEKMDNDLLKKTKMFEKIELKWFTVSMMRKQTNTFRVFYRSILKLLLKELPQIKEFLFKNSKLSKQIKRRSTRRTRTTRREYKSEE
tara:strand:+ start:1751 stop:2356 length:606 start_codon:yes stop_codon:yes gene_type:complete